MSEVVAALADEARATPHARPGIEALSRRAADAGQAAFGEAVAALLGAHDPGAVALLLAGAAVGFPLDPAQVRRALALTHDLTHLALLAGRCGAATVDVLTAAARMAHQDAEWRLVSALLAAERVAAGGATAPRELLAELRMHARLDYEPELAYMVGLAAEALQDPGLEELAGDWREAACRGRGPAHMRERLLGRLSLDMEVLAALPAEPPVRAVAAGFTVRRATEKVGRNDPCPCGSKKKYKKCCEGKDRARNAEASPVPGVTLAEYLADPGRYLRPEDVHRLGPAELARLDLAKLPTLHLITAIRRQALLEQWDRAEQGLDVLAERTDLPGESSAWEYRLEVIDDALRVGATDVVARQRAKVEAEGGSEAIGDLELELELRAPTAETVGRLDAAALEALRAPEGHGAIDLAYALLEAFPALGILVARGAIDPARVLDSETLLDEIERARDLLGLSPDDSAGRAYDDALATRERREAEAGTEAREREELLAEAQRLRKELQAAHQRAQEAERQASARPERAAGAPEARPTGKVDATERAELERLRAKVDELKQEVADRNRERRQLRRELDDARRALEERPESAPTREPATRGDEAPDPGELPLPEEATRGVLPPALAAAAEQALHRVPTRVAQHALRLIGALAAGEPTAWRGVKRLRDKDGLLSARVGIHYRLILRADARTARLDVLDFVPREGFDTALRRLSG